MTSKLHVLNQLSTYLMRDFFIAEKIEIQDSFFFF